MAARPGLCWWNPTPPWLIWAFFKGTPPKATNSQMFIEVSTSKARGERPLFLVVIGYVGQAAHALLIPDYFSFRLTGNLNWEYTNATTTQFFDARERRWATELLEALGLPTRMLPEVVQPGTPLLAIVPLDRVWVEANYKEGQLGDVRAGQKVALHSDLYGTGVEYAGTVTGLGAGTGAAFALLPAQNATGNWIKIVQRVPVRITLDAAQLKTHPLRVGLSMEVKVDVTRTDGPLVAQVGRSQPVAETRLFEALEREADERVQKIVAQQLGRARAAL